ncbi:MAG: hypothetical protein ACM3OC_04740 [Deltaproteobacteria bacterium]
MAKVCKRCRVPLEGFGAKIAGFLFGVKPSQKDPELCNKCEDKPQDKGKGCGCRCCH